MTDDLGRVPPAPGSHAPHEAPAGLRPSGFDPSRVLRALLIAAPHHQGHHSGSGRAIAEALCIPFPLTMPSLRAAAIDCGFHPYAVWPWLDELENGE